MTDFPTIQNWYCVPGIVADADLPAALAELLGDHLRRGIRVKEAMPDHLADHFRRASVMGLRPAPKALQCLRPCAAKAERN